MHIPTELYVGRHEDKPFVLLNAPLMQSMPGLADSFEAIDKRYQKSPQAFLRFMDRNLFRFGIEPTFNEEEVDEYHTVNASLIADQDTAASDDLLVVLPPMNGIKPGSSADIMEKYISALAPGYELKRQAKPKSWNQLSKSATIHELLKEQGLGMPVLTVFNPVSPLTVHELWGDIKDGNHSAFGIVVEAGIRHAQLELERNYERRRDQGFDKVHFFAAGLGFNAIGAAEHMRALKHKFAYRVGSVTLQNLVLGARNRLDLFAHALPLSRLTQVGEPSGTQEPGLGRIKDPLFRRAIQEKGGEPDAHIQLGNSIIFQGYYSGAFKPKWTSEFMRNLVGNGVPISVVNAINSSQTRHTDKYLPESEENFFRSHIVGIEDYMADLETNEQASLGAIIALGGIKNAKELGR